MADAIFHMVTSPEDAGFTEGEADVVKAATAHLYGLLRSLPQELAGSVTVSLLVTLMLNNTDDPDAAWAVVDKLVRANMQKARIQAGTAGSA